ncbi:MAG: hypothetical protein KGD68_13165 [Candidatus Lokiarchaeota archaeon]|nr:hypothetical protein [Candidatus Lokiarchaeota archaeon]
MSSLLFESSILFEPIGDKNFSAYLGDTESSEKHKWWAEKNRIISSTWCPQSPSGKTLEAHKWDIAPIVKEMYIDDLVEKIKHIPVHFATIDLGLMNLKEFNQTYFAKALNKYEIPYFTVKLLHHEKEDFSNELLVIQKKCNELKTTYDSLKDRNTPSAQELKYLIDHYSKELMELKQYIDQEIPVDAISTRILQLIKDRDSEDLTFVHFGEEDTFAEIVNQSKEQNIKSNIIFVQKSKFLHSIN